MNNIVIKTEHMIKNVNYSNINFIKIVSLALGKIDQNKLIPLDDENIKIVLPLTECIEILGYKNKTLKTSKDNINSLIKKGVKKTVVTLTKNDDVIEKKVLITGYNTSLKRNEITIFFNKELFYYMYIKYKDINGKICNNRYICYDLNMFINCNNLYTYRVYELFKLYSYKVNTYDLTFDELKKYLNIEHKNIKIKNDLEKIEHESYIDYKIFKRVILAPAIKYINENTDLNVTIVKENKCKDRYIINGVEKEVTSLKRVFFEITENRERANKSNTINKLALYYNKSIEEINLMLEKLGNVLNSEGIYLNKNQITVLMDRCKDETLIKYVLIDAKDKRSINDLGGYSYYIIDNLIKNEEVEQYKRDMILKYKNKFKRKLKNFELTEDMKKNKELVNVYDLYNIYRGSIFEKDVASMQKCLLKYGYSKTVSAVNKCFEEKKGEPINSFIYIEKILEKGRFNGRRKKKDLIKQASYDCCDEF